VAGGDQVRDRQPDLVGVVELALDALEQGGLCPLHFGLGHGRAVEALDLVHSSAATSSTSPSSGSCAYSSSRPGSCSSNFAAPAPVALPPSTSALCRRPAGVSPRTWASTASAAVSACAA